MIKDLIQRLVAYEDKLGKHGQNSLSSHLMKGFLDYAEKQRERSYAELLQEFPELKLIDDFSNNLTVRARRALSRAGVRKIGDLTDYTERGFREASRKSKEYSYGAGEKTLAEIRRVLLEPYDLDFKEEEPSKPVPQRYLRLA